MITFMEKNPQDPWIFALVLTRNLCHPVSGERGAGPGERSSLSGVVEMTLERCSPCVTARKLTLCLNGYCGHSRGGYWLQMSYWHN